MPIGIYIRTDKMRKNMSLAQKGNKNSMYGKSSFIKNKTYEEYYGEERAKKITEKRSKSLKGKNAGNKNGMFGKHSWNFNKTKENDERVKKVSKTKKERYDSGQTVIWNKDLTKETDLRVKKNGESVSKTRLERGLGRGEKNGMYKNGFLISGDKNGRWLNGKSFEPYGQEFNNTLKKQIRKRDNYCCQECFSSQNELGYTLQVHHINYNKKNNNSDNLISLCRSCHSKTNGDRENWKEYFREIIVINEIIRGW